MSQTRTMSLSHWKCRKQHFLFPWLGTDSSRTYCGKCNLWALENRWFLKKTSNSNIWNLMVKILLIESLSQTQFLLRLSYKHRSRGTSGKNIEANCKLWSHSFWMALSLCLFNNNKTGHPISWKILLGMHFKSSIQLSSQV